MTNHIKIKDHIQHAQEAIQDGNKAACMYHIDRALRHLRHDPRVEKWHPEEFQNENLRHSEIVDRRKMVHKPFNKMI